MTSNLIRNCTKEKMPENVVHFFIEMLDSKYEFAEEDLLPLESELIQFKPKTKVR